MPCAWSTRTRPKFTRPFSLLEDGVWGRDQGGAGMHIINILSHDKPILQSDWPMEIPQHRPKNSAQVTRPFSLLEGAVCGRDFPSPPTPSQVMRLHAQCNSVHHTNYSCPSICLVCPLRKVNGNDLTAKRKMQYLWLSTVRG